MMGIRRNEEEREGGNQAILKKSATKYKTYVTESNEDTDELNIHKPN